MMEPLATASIESVRRFYAEEICRLNHISSPAIRAAFATVPRERFVGPGPWIIQVHGDSWRTPDSDPRQLYIDGLVVLDEARHLNNGQPSLWAFHLGVLRMNPGDHVLHLGCGTGYYTAIMAELTGPQGKVTAVEMNEGLAERARIALEPWPQVSVFQGNGALGPFQPADVIVVSAGATHPLAAWLAAVKPQGKLLFPLTSTRGPGTMAHLVRKSAEWFHAELIGPAFFVDFLGARDAAISSDLAKALKRDHGASVRSLRCDPHQADSTCWLHGDQWCFSRRSPEPAIEN
jgi:protein-L-isoaspartate(D-aspartate) O-methyltransferase